MGEPSWGREDDRVPETGLLRVPEESCGMTLDEYAQHVARFSTVVSIDGDPWRMGNRVLGPMAMPHRVPPVDRAKVRRAMRETGALVARWHDAWDTEPCDYWFLCCDDPEYDIDKIPSKNARRDVRAGLRHCDVRRVEPVWIAEHGYQVYAAAYERGGQETVPVSEREYVSGTKTMAELDGFEVWAAFIGGRLVSHAQCIVMDDAVDVWSVKTDPVYLKSCPNNALFYELTHDYLQERGLLYVMAGGRAIHHPGKIERFRERMGWRRTYCPLRLQLAPVTAVVVASRAHWWARCLGLGRLSPRTMANLKAVASLAKIAKACRGVPPGAATLRGAESDEVPSHQTPEQPERNR